MLSDVSPLSVSSSDSQHQVFEYINPRAIELFGYTLEDVPDLATWWLRAYPDPAYRQQVMDKWTSQVVPALANNTRLEEPFETQVTCKDGSQRIIQWHFASVDGKSVRFGLDVTPRKEAERELHLVSERLQVATQAASIGIWDWDVVKNKLVWDDAMYPLYGIDREDFSGGYEAWRQALHPADVERMDQAIQAALRGEREYDEEFRIVRPDGSLRHLHATARTSRDADGKPLRMVGVNYDVTERKHSEEALRSSRQMLQSVLDHFPGAVFWKDLASTYLGSNRACASAAGLAEPEDIIGKTDFELWDPADAPGYVADDRQVMTQGVAKLGIIEKLLKADGETIWFETNKVPIRNESGEVIGILGSATDITLRMRTEQELRLATDRLQLATHAAGIGSWDWDVVTGESIWDDAMCHLYGREDSLGYEAWTKVVHPEDLERMEKAIQAALQGERDYIEEFRIFWPDGSLRHLHASGRAFLGCRRKAHPHGGRQLRHHRAEACRGELRVTACK